MSGVATPDPKRGQAGRIVQMFHLVRAADRSRTAPLMKQRGHTLLEILVVCGLVGLLITTVMACYWMFNRSSRSQLSRIEARQQLRTSIAMLRPTSIIALHLRRLQRFLRLAPLCRAQPQHRQHRRSGRSDFRYASERSGPPACSGKSAECRSYREIPRDPNNPTAMDLVVQVVENVGPAKFDDPSEIDQFSGVSWPGLEPTLRRLHRRQLLWNYRAPLAALGVYEI